MSERETLDVDVVIVGGGPAGLSAALRLAQLQKAAGRRSASPCSKRRRSRSASAIGAVLDPRALAELIPDYAGQGSAARVESSRGSRLLPHGGGQDRSFP